MAVAMNRELRYGDHEQRALLADLLREGIRRQDWTLVARARDMLSGSVTVSGWVVYDYSPGETLYDVELNFDSLYLTRAEACECASRIMLRNITLDLTVRHMSATGGFVSEALPRMVNRGSRLNASATLQLAKEALNGMPRTRAMQVLALNEEGRRYFEGFFEFLDTQILSDFEDDFDEVEDFYVRLSDHFVATKRYIGIAQMPFDTIDPEETSGDLS